MMIRSVVRGRINPKKVTRHVSDLMAYLLLLLTSKILKLMGTICITKSKCIPCFKSLKRTQTTALSVMYLQKT